MANLGTRIFTLLFGKKVGEDGFGNKYYQSSIARGKNVGRYGKERRWVIYKGKAEPTKIPPEWHGWIHYSFDEPPQVVAKFKWQKDHLPNLTGTDYAYLPSGHKESKGHRDKATGDYEAWKPN
ncbi:MAG: NADH:ubiquinone oxidoreductase subunit NDUFA12 [Rickettsiales bacterium]|nr:NADH:ubiquinone oxidoreductase subunit NDUFA12 [Rickettsiales bacterium]